MQKMKYIMLSTLFLSLGVFTSCNKSQPILIIGAMDMEINTLLEKMNNPQKQNLDKYDYYQGNVNNHSVIVLKSDIGMSNASASTALAIKSFNPKCVINEGTAGAHEETIKLYHIFLGKEVTNFGSYIMPSYDDPTTWTLEQENLYGDTDLLKIANETEYSEGKSEGNIGSSDAWDKDPNYIKKINAAFHTVSEDMESYSILKVCQDYKIPCLNIRIISNNELDKSQGSDLAGAAKKCQEYVYEVVKNINA